MNKQFAVGFCIALVLGLIAGSLWSRYTSDSGSSAPMGRGWGRGAMQRGELQPTLLTSQDSAVPTRPGRGLGLGRQAARGGCGECSGAEGTCTGGGGGCGATGPSAGCSGGTGCGSGARAACQENVAGCAEAGRGGQAGCPFPGEAAGSSNLPTGPTAFGAGQGRGLGRSMGRGYGRWATQEATTTTGQPAATGSAAAAGATNTERSPWSTNE